MVHAIVPDNIFCRWAPNWFLKSSGWRFACSIVPRVFRGCSVAVARPSGLLFAVQLFRLARPHKMVPLLLITLIFIYYGEICGGASKQTKDGSPEPNRRRKQWIGGVGLKKVFRGGVRGVRAGVRGGMRECSAPIEIRRNRKESQKSLFFEVTLKRYTRRCPRQFLSFEFLYIKKCTFITILR